MSEQLHTSVSTEWIEDRDEIDGVLAALQGLLARVASPIVRACLEDVLEDIAHLTNHDLSAPASEEEESEAA